ncbi:MAG: c-type cytochrome [Candidatus Polarisedimenticolia bacterium]
MTTSPSRLAAAGFVLICAASHVAAQIPDKFTNLQVLPKDATKAQVVEAMRGFAGALGVRCNHCHVGENVMTLEGFNFAADDKETKKVARAMMQMTREINEKLLPAIGRQKVVEVRCITCHRGLSKPETLDRILLATVDEKGVPAAIDQYKELRGTSFGRGGYDFSFRTLNVVAETLARGRNDLDGAIAVTRANLEFNQDDANLHCFLGELLVRKEDKPSALGEYKRCLELAPDNQRAKAQIEALSAAPKAP